MKQILSIIAVALTLQVPAIAGNGHEHEGHAHAPAPATFIENLGQWPAPVLFRTGANGAALFIENNGWTWSKLEASAADRMHDIAELSPEEQATIRFQGHAWRVRFVGYERSSTVKGMDKAVGYHNYFLGNDPGQWTSRVGLYGKVMQTGVWPGIDVALATVEGNFKYDILIAPGADAGRIGLAYEGLDGIELAEGGVLAMKTSVGDLTELAPVAFYGDERGGAVACAFALEGTTVRFTFPKGYDTSRPVVIDPLLVAATYSGATGASNYGHCAAFDDAGNIYSAGRNFGPSYPVTVGAFQTEMGGGGTDISLSKYNPDGSELVWASYLGGSSGENPHSLVANAAGELVVLGSSSSADFPVTDGAYDATVNSQDITVTHFSVDGTSLIGSTYLGGSGSDGTNQMGGNYGEAYRGEVYVDGTGNLLVTSFTSSSDFPVTTGASQPALGGGQDGVVVKLDPACTTLLASTYLGGTTDDNAMGIRIASNGDFFVTGTSDGAGMTMPAGGYMPSFQGGTSDAYVLRITNDLTTVVAGTYFGTNDMDRGYFIDLDSGDNVWLYGQTNGTVPIFPSGTYGEVGGEVFLAKFTPDLTTAPVTTMIPGSLAPVAFLVDVCDHVYISGYAAGGNLPLTPDALHETGSFYLASFDVDMAGILFGTHYGGSHVDGGTSRFDKNGIVYQGVCSGGQSMQSTTWAYAPQNQISWDIAVFKIDFETAGVQANITSTSINGCIPASFTLSATGQAVEYTWDLGDGSPTQTGEQITVTYNEVGAYLVTLIGSDPASCNIADTARIILNVYDPAELLAAFDPVPLSSCDGYFLNLTNNSVGATQYSWDFGDGSSSTNQAPSHQYAAPGTYLVELEVLNTVCADTATTTLPVTFAEPEIPFDPPTPVAICPGSNALLDAGPGYDTYEWSTGNMTQTLTVAQVGVYEITVSDGFCEATDSVEVIQAPLPPPSPDVFTCGGVPVVIAPSYPVSTIQWDAGPTTPGLTVSEGGTYGFAAVDSYGCDTEGAVTVIEIPVERGTGFIPNVFTPNNDQKNDRFEVVGEGIEQFHMEVYDRWGMKMFETASQTNGWNGGLDNSLGSAVPDGTYYYIIDFKDLCQDEPYTTRKGHVTLLR